MAIHPRTLKTLELRISLTPAEADAALEALEAYMNGHALPSNVSERAKMLTSAFTSARNKFREKKRKRLLKQQKRK